LTTKSQIIKLEYILKKYYEINNIMIDLMSGINPLIKNNILKESELTFNNEESFVKLLFLINRN
jgi:hypothetical protein